MRMACPALFQRAALDSARYIAGGIGPGRAFAEPEASTPKLCSLALGNSCAAAPFIRLGTGRTPLNRRQMLRGTIALSAAASLRRLQAAESGFVEFGPSTVRDIARARSARPFEPPDEKLPDALKDLNYDQYRSIRFLPERALWLGENLPFQAQFFHRGFFYKNRVELFEVSNGRATPIHYRRGDFSYGPDIGQWPDVDLGFAGFRIHAPINRPDYYDEVCVFLGASYFRAVA